ncbi:S-adenosyl-L-methionine-dependent methyltransferase, partial [Pavlovales sp. CCMP2436]
GYSAEQLAAAGGAANLGLGCGSPVAFATLLAGETVLDLGCGAGLDALLAAHIVGSLGSVIGVDMTAEMLARAREGASRLGLDGRASFRLGELEHLPVRDGEVDVVIANCTVNLCADKAGVFAEAFRALRPGGRLAMTDVVLSGAPEQPALTRLIEAAGFVNVCVREKPSADLIASWMPGSGAEDFVTSALVTA